MASQDVDANILLTGANGGIGLGVLESLLSSGFRNIACLERNSRGSLEKLLLRFDLDPSKHIFGGSLDSESSLSALRGQIEDRIGQIDTLLNVAGASTNAMFWKLSLTDFLEVVNANLTTAFLCSREFAPAMRKNEKGRIINFTSIVGTTGVVGAAHYCAAKAGLIGLTKSMALELANKNVTVNAIALGYYNTGLIRDVPEGIQRDLVKNIPVGRLGEPADVGALVQYIMSPAASFLTGQVIHLNGGQV